MTSDHLVSIIIPLYNRATLLEQSVQSVKSQTYANWELIIVDDGSTDGSFELAQSFSRNDQRIKTYQRERLPKGAPTCRNIGASVSRGKYLIFLDSDDLLAPFCLQQRIDRFYMHQDADMIIFLMLLFQQYPYDQDILWNIATQEDDLSRHLKGENLWQTSGAMYRKNYFLNTGGFREDLPFWQDYELHTRMLIKQPIYHKAFDLPPDCFIRRHQEDFSISQKGLKSKEQLVKRLEIYNSLVKLLRQDRQKSSSYQLDIASTFYMQSQQFLEELDDLKRSRDSWKRSRKLVNFFDYRLGYLSLFCLHLKSTKKSKVLGFLHRALRYLMNTKIRKRNPKMCRVKYEH